MDTIILLLFVTSLISQQALCQEVASRASGNKVNGAEGDGQQRNIYSQKHLSPHRMMHFGKRPSNVEPPTILSPQVFDPYLSNEQQQQLLQRQQRSVAYLQSQENPFLFSIELEQGRTIQALPEGLAPFETLQQQQQQQQQPGRDTLYNFERRPQVAAELFGYNLADQAAMRQAANQALGKHKLMKLIQSNEADENSAAIGFNINGERAQSSENGQDDNGQQQQQGREQPAISVSTRSMQSSRANNLNLPKAYISSLLYGRQGSSSMPNYTGFNKKAEPKENFFMHFGRK